MCILKYLSYRYFIVLRRRDTKESTVFDKMLPVDDNDRYFIFIGPQTGLYDLGYFLKVNVQNWDTFGVAQPKPTYEEKMRVASGSMTYMYFSKKMNFLT